MLTELDRYVTAGSQVLVVADGPGVADQVTVIGQKLANLNLTYRAADTTNRAVLDTATAEGYEHVVVMSYSDKLDEQRADAQTLVTLLHLRDIESKRGESFTIVSEMLDVRNRALAVVTRADDFIVSGKLVSLMMSQLAENPELRAVFDDLFDEAGSEVYLKPAADYVRLDEPVDFYTIVESARRRGEVAFGYRVLAEAEDSDKAYGVVINPDKAGQRDADGRRQGDRPRRGLTWTPSRDRLPRFSPLALTRPRWSSISTSSNATRDAWPRLLPHVGSRCGRTSRRTKALRWHASSWTPAPAGSLSERWARPRSWPRAEFQTSCSPTPSGQTGGRQPGCGRSMSGPASDSPLVSIRSPGHRSLAERGCRLRQAIAGADRDRSLVPQNRRRAGRNR